MRIGTSWPSLIIYSVLKFYLQVSNIYNQYYLLFALMKDFGTSGFIMRISLSL